MKLGLKSMQLAMTTVLILGGLNSLPLLADPVAIAAFEQNDLSGAKQQFSQQLAKNTKDTEALHYLARIAMRHDELDQAEDYIERAQAIAPDDAAIQFVAARIMGGQAQSASIFSAPGYAKKSLKAFKKAAELEPETLDYRKGLMSFYLQAPGFLGGDEKLALAEAAAIAELDELQGIIAMASIYLSKEDFPQLSAHYAAATEKFPHSPALFVSRGMSYQAREQYELAIADFALAKELKGQDQEDVSPYTAMYQLGRSSVLGGIEIEQGIQALHTFIDTAPEDKGLSPKAWAKYRLGLLYSKKGDNAKARELYLQANNETRDENLLEQLEKALKKKHS